LQNDRALPGAQLGHNTIPAICELDGIMVCGWILQIDLTNLPTFCPVFHRLLLEKRPCIQP
jgi:hypothetical protein